MGGLLIKGHLSNLQDLHSVSFKNKSVLIVGIPGSGKTYVANYIIRNLTTSHNVIHTDNYMQYGYDVSLYKIIDDIKDQNHSNLIIEGIQGYRLLRHGAKHSSFRPNIVIQIETDEDHISKVYYKERGKDKLNHIKAVIKGTEDILTEYKFYIRNKSYHPDWYILRNDFII